MRVLVAVASRHGSTRQIGDRIGAKLHDAGFDVRLDEVDRITHLDDVDAIVLGSAVYMGRWEPAARLFVDEYLEELAAIPAWVFSSGPIGLFGSTPGSIRDHEETVHALSAVDSRLFGGDLNLENLSMGERLISKLLRVPAGDFRDWDAIEQWAGTIAQALVPDLAISTGGRAS